MGEYNKEIRLKLGANPRRIRVRCTSSAQREAKAYRDRRGRSLMRGKRNIAFGWCF